MTETTPDRAEGEKTAAERARELGAACFVDSISWAPGQECTGACLTSEECERGQFAAALLAAEQRGAEQMRRRCANLNIPGLPFPFQIAFDQAVRALTIPAPEEKDRG